jgi:hypothetical protein
MSLKWKPGYDQCDCLTTKAARCANVADHAIKTDKGSHANLCHCHYRRWVYNQFLVIGTKWGVEARPS